MAQCGVIQHQAITIGGERADQLTEMGQGRHAVILKGLVLLLAAA